MPLCKSCHAPIRWERTANGKAVPLDAEPVKFGGTIVVRSGVAIYLPKGAAALVDEPLYKSHFATCKDSKAWRKKE